MRYVNDLYDAMTQKKGREVTARILEQLVDYTVKHFAHEEQWFAKSAYPDTPAHQKEHQELAKQVSAFGAAFAAGKATVDSELLNFLRSWLMNHIMKSDKKYVAHLKAAGAN